MKAPSYHTDSPINGYWEGGLYLSSSPKPVYNLTWALIWSFIRLKISSPRRDKFKIAIMDYGYDS